MSPFQMLMVPSIFGRSSSTKWGKGLRLKIRKGKKKTCVSRRQKIDTTEVTKQVSETQLVELSRKCNHGQWVKGESSVFPDMTLSSLSLDKLDLIRPLGSLPILHSPIYSFHSVSMYFTEMLTVLCPVLSAGYIQVSKMMNPHTPPCFTCIPQDEQTVLDDSQFRSMSTVELWCNSPWNLTCSTMIPFVSVLITKHSFSWVALKHIHLKKKKKKSRLEPLNNYETI